MPNPYGIENEESKDHPDLHVCRGLRQSWPEFWSDFQYYGWGLSLAARLQYEPQSSHVIVGELWSFAQCDRRQYRARWGSAVAGTANSGIPPLQKPNPFGWVKSMRWISGVLTLSFVLFAAQFGVAQSSYQVISVERGGTIKGTVKWQGAMPHLTPSEINQDPQVCDPLGQKHRDLERLLVSPDGGVANTVVFLRNITAGKAMDLLAQRRFLNQKNCRYEPHILLVPVQATLTVKSSDPVLHTVHMSGSADYNLPFVSEGQEISRQMTREGVVDLRCNAGHVWMNDEMMVAPHPYYAVTDAEATLC